MLVGIGYGIRMGTALRDKARLRLDVLTPSLRFLVVQRVRASASPFGRGRRVRGVGDSTDRAVSGEGRLHRIARVQRVSRQRHKAVQHIFRGRQCRWADDQALRLPVATESRGRIPHDSIQHFLVRCLPAVSAWPLVETALLHAVAAVHVRISRRHCTVAEQTTVVAAIQRPLRANRPLSSLQLLR